MGFCTLPSGRVEPGWIPSDCRASSGTYSETDPRTNPDNTTDGPKKCFITTIMTRALSQNMLDLGKTYSAQIKFRDQVLDSSSFGKQMIALYYKFNPVLIPIALRNFGLIAKAIQVWFTIYPYVQAVVNLSEGISMSKELFFAKETYDEILKITDEIRRETSNTELHDALSYIEKELSKYVGLSPKEALNLLKS